MIAYLRGIASIRWTQLDKLPATGRWIGSNDTTQRPRLSNSRRTPGKHRVRLINSTEPFRAFSPSQLISTPTPKRRQSVDTWISSFCSLAEMSWTLGYSSANKAFKFGTAPVKLWRMRDSSHGCRGDWANFDRIGGLFSQKSSPWASYTVLPRPGWPQTSLELYTGSREKKGWIILFFLIHLSTYYAQDFFEMRFLWHGECKPPAIHPQDLARSWPIPRWPAQKKSWGKLHMIIPFLVPSIASWIHHIFLKRVQTFFACVWHSMPDQWSVRSCPIYKHALVRYWAKVHLKRNGCQLWENM